MLSENDSLMIEADDIKNQIHKLLPHIDKMKNDCQSTVDICDQISLRKGDYLEDYTLKMKLYDLIGRIRLHLFKMYSEMLTPTFCNGKPPSARAAVNDVYINNVFENEIHLTVSEGKIYLRLPLIWSRYRQSSWYDQHKIESDYFPFFVDEIHNIMMSNIDAIPSMTSKHIHFLYIISPTRHNPTDTDNYDTKAMVDAITSYLHGGDAALCCSFSAITMIHEELPEGTYITVSPTLNAPNFDENKACWQQIFLQKKYK